MTIKKLSQNLKRGVKKYDGCYYQKAMNFIHITSVHLSCMLRVHTQTIEIPKKYENIIMSTNITIIIIERKKLEKN